MNEEDIEKVYVIDNSLGALEYEIVGVIRRIPIEHRGMSKNGIPWTLGGVLLEVPDKERSHQLYLTVWGDELVETVKIGRAHV